MAFSLSCCPCPVFKLKDNKKASEHTWQLYANEPIGPVLFHKTVLVNSDISYLVEINILRAAGKKRRKHNKTDRLTGKMLKVLVL